jgi:hypothetical protein
MPGLNLSPQAHRNRTGFLPLVYGDPYGYNSPFTQEDYLPRNHPLGVRAAVAD